MVARRESGTLAWCDSARGVTTADATDTTLPCAPTAGHQRPGLRKQLVRAAVQRTGPHVSSMGKSKMEGSDDPHLERAQRDRPCEQSEETFVNSAGKALYTIVVADYRACGVTAKPPG